MAGFFFFSSNSVRDPHHGADGRSGSVLPGKEGGVWQEKQGQGASVVQAGTAGPGT